MNTIEVFDTALCCSTGVCGPAPDSELAAFASAIEGLKKRGSYVNRHNLAQEPLAFAQHPEVKAILENTGDSALPLVFVDGALKFRGSYPTAAQLERALGFAPVAFAKATAPDSVKPTGARSCCDPSTGCC